MIKIKNKILSITLVFAVLLSYASFFNVLAEEESIEFSNSDFGYITEFDDVYRPEMFAETSYKALLGLGEELSEPTFEFDDYVSADEAGLIYAQNSVTLIAEDKDVTFTYDVAFPMTYTSDRQHYAYCIERGKHSPDTEGTSMDLSGYMSNSGVKFILANGLSSPSRARNPKYLSGNTYGDYGVTQYALWVYLGYITEYSDPFSASETGGNATLLWCAKNLYEDAVNYRNYGVSLSITPGSTSFHLEGSNFVSGWYYLEYARGTMSSYTVSLANAPSGTQIQYDGNWFRLVVSKAYVHSNATIRVSVTGTFYSDEGCMYHNGDGSYQKMLVAEFESKTEYATNTAYAELNAMGVLQVYVFNEEFDEITQESKYTSKNAGGIRINVRGEENYSQLTDTSGYAGFSEILLGDYNISESGLPVQYIYPPSQNVHIEPGETTTVYFYNTMKKGTVGCIKKCTYYGNVRVKGAVYGVYRSRDNALVGKITSSADYEYLDKLLPYGFYGYLQEITPPKYYAPDDERYYFSITENDQKVKITAWNTPYSEVWPEFIVPNSDYRNSTEIIASYYIHNNSIAERRPNTGQGNVCPLVVDFVAKDEKGNVVSSQTVNVNVPKFDKNLVYFKLKVPDDCTGLTFTCTIRDPVGTVETGNNHTAKNDFVVKPAPTSQTPDTIFENKPSNFVLPSSSQAVPTGDLTRSVTDKASWQVWEWINNAFTLKTYGIQLKIENTVTPDTAVKSQIKTSKGYEIKSGYAISHSIKSSMIARSGMTFSNDYYLPQHANDFYPEFNYKFTSERFSSFDLTAKNLFELQQNKFATNDKGQVNNRRIHFSPLWFPDTNYTVKSYVYDAWTPSGMLSIQDTVSSVKIDGDAYDDWFVNHQEQ